MKFLTDTNVISRMAQLGHALQSIAEDAANALIKQGHKLCLVPQNFYEFWVVCTRPLSVNGLGKTIPEVVNELATLKSLYTFLPDSQQLYDTWEQLVSKHAVQGKAAHDARL